MFISLTMIDGGHVLVNTQRVVWCASYRQGATTVVFGPGETEFVVVTETLSDIKRLTNAVGGKA